MKGNDEVIRDFNEYVNMTADELEKWLKSDDSRSAGWPKGESAGESVGHDSGRKIVEILKANPKKESKKYTDDQVSHMRKVASYCARHLAQEEKSNNEKSPEEVKKTKSYASLKNWGHDPLKKRGAKGTNTAKSTANGKSAGTKKSVDKGAEKDDQDEDGDDAGEEKDENANKRAGDKRKAAGAQQGKNKEAKTEQSTEKRATRSSSRNKPSEEKEEKPPQPEKKTAAKEENKKKDNKKKDEENTEREEKESEDTGKKSNNNNNNNNNKKSGGKGGKGPKPGEKVSWNWGNGQPEGKVLDVKDDKATITTKRGNQVSRDGNPGDPAVIIDTGKSKAIKSNHELN